MNIGYVCTNYNNSSFTCEAIRSLTENAGHQFHIVVVDNNSGGTSVAELQKCAGEHSNVELILNAENLGYFRGLNAGIVRLRYTHPEVEAMVIGNNDLVFPSDFGDSILRNQDKLQTHAVIAPNIVTLDGVHQNPHVIQKISKLREVVYDLYYSNYHLAMIIRKLAKLTTKLTDRDDETQHEVAQPISQGHGACYILGPVFFEHFTELWAPTFLMGEEYFLSKQLEDKGLRKFYEPSIIVQHYQHAAVDKIPSRKLWEMSRDAHNLYRKHVRPF
jgi:glycosyltransferase involved in cell wall biosynthesis